jgi:hypothetical protein
MTKSGQVRAHIAQPTQPSLNCSIGLCPFAFIFSDIRNTFAGQALTQSPQLLHCSSKTVIRPFAIGKIPLQ